MVTIRSEEAADADAVRAINEQAFGQATEADLVDALREHCPDVLSLVAEDDLQLVGHLLLTPATVEASDGRRLVGMGLAPMAVVPGRQCQGIGSMLVRRALELLRERNCPFVIVLGHPGFYPRFGFEPASHHSLACQWEGVPDEAFMVVILEPDTMRGVTGVARYCSEFDEAV